MADLSEIPRSDLPALVEQGLPLAEYEAEIARRKALAAVPVAEKLYRVQDADGRGPFKPGFTASWADPQGKPFLPAAQEISGFARIVAKAHREGLHIGTAVVGFSGLDRWFTGSEMARLSSLGYRIVSANSCKVIARDQNQVLIASPLPLKFLPVAPLPPAPEVVR